MPTEPSGGLIALRGPDHTVLGAIATRHLGPDIAIALSRGKYPKGYPATEPNEDGALASRAPGSTLLSVVDGHNGFAAAAAVLDVLAAALPDLHGTQPLSRVIVDSQALVRDDSGCSVLIARLGPNGLRLCSVGDATAVLVRGRRVRRLTKITPHLERNLNVTGAADTRVSVRAGDVLILGTDGLFDFLGAAARTVLRQAATEPIAEEIASHLVNSAFAGGAGDNIAVAVARLNGPVAHTN